MRPLIKVSGKHRPKGTGSDHTVGASMRPLIKVSGKSLRDVVRGLH